MTRRAWLAAAGATIAAALLIEGCALRRPDAVPVDWAQRQARLLALDAWQARGRIAVKADSGGGQGDLHWQQSGVESRVRVSGPFGAGAYDIRWDPGMLSIASRNGEYAQSYAGADAAERFLAGHLGWSFPAASARFWLLGVPDPEFPAEQRFGAAGELMGIDQNGWRVTYARFVEQGGLRMPAKIGIEGERARLRVIVDRWDLH